jgi:hypothetical protein
MYLNVLMIYLIVFECIHSIFQSISNLLILYLWCVLMYLNVFECIYITLQYIYNIFQCI